MTDDDGNEMIHVMYRFQRFFGIFDGNFYSRLKYHMPKPKIDARVGSLALHEIHFPR